MRNEVNFSLNGKFLSVSGADALLPLSSYLRYRLNQIGTKVVCAEGDCGACTVLLTRMNAKGKRKFLAINSCIFPTYLIDGHHLITVEGTRDPNDKLSEVQQSLVREFGTQCGFCTPGFVMAMEGMLENKKQPNEQNIKNYLTGNLCRCTGYAPILKAAQSISPKKRLPLSKRVQFPRIDSKYLKKLETPLQIQIGNCELYAPSKLTDATTFLKKYPQTRIVAGATDLGVQKNKGKNIGNQLLSLHLIPELEKISILKTKIRIGSKVTLASLQRVLERNIPEFARFINIFASPQIKNTATLVGNLMNGSPIADTTPVLFALNGRIKFVNSQRSRLVFIRELFQGYKKLDVKKDEIVVSLEFEIPNKNQIVRFYKSSQRRDLDISCVNAAYSIEFFKDGRVSSFYGAMGGVGPMPLELNQLSNWLHGKRIEDLDLNEASGFLFADIKPLSDVRGNQTFRKRLSMSLLRKFLRECC